MRNVFTLLLIVFLQCISYSQQGWYILSIGQSGSGGASDMKFTDAQTGYVTYQGGNGHYNYGGINKTTNGGINWFQLEYGIPKYGIFFLNNSTGWMTGGYWDDAGKRSNEVFKTTNGGTNFVRQYIDSTLSSFNEIFFIDANTGWMITWNSSLLKTTNSGINWTLCLSQQLYSVFFINTNMGWGAGNNGTVFKTSNGGQNWSSQSICQNTLWEVFFIDANTGWVCGSSVFIYKSTDGGINWTGYYSGEHNVFSIEFFDHNKGWASGDSGKIVYTLNGGVNWIQQSSGVNHGFSMLCFPNENTGYARGSKILTMYPFVREEVFIKTTTGGITFVHNINSEIPKSFSLSQNYPNPFNPTTKIKFSLPYPSKGGALDVQLIVYDVLGKKIANLIPPLWGGKEGLQPGSYEVEWDASNYPSGVYFYKLIINDYTETKKMVLIK
jgi:photosystem II stability/assembly factor-like uncharacterized protein